jgi:Tfp pilus assembly protein PilE
MKKRDMIPTFHSPRTNGMTFTELLIASILIGIVMIGALSFSQAVKQIHRSTDRSTIPAARVAAAMARIQRDGALMSGDSYYTPAQPPDIGSGLFIYEDAGTNAYGICFRQDADDDPSVFTNDQWACYSHNGDRKIWRCIVDEADIGSFAGCAAGGVFAKPIIHLSTGSEDFYDVVDHVENGRTILDRIDVTLTTKIDPDDASNDPVANPGYTLTSSINPWMQGR